MAFGVLRLGLSRAFRSNVGTFGVDLQGPFARFKGFRFCKGGGENKGSTM